MIFKIKWWYYGLMFDLNCKDARMYSDMSGEEIENNNLNKADKLNKKTTKYINKMRYYNKKKDELLLSIKGDK